MKNYFSSDWHLDHKNILKYDNRPFKTVEEMNNVIIGNYNNIVKDGDNFYFLGDFSFNNQRTEEFLSQLRGNLFFIKGNHDKYDTIKLYRKYGNYLGEQAKVNVQGQEIVLNHYSMRVWDKSHRNTLHLYAHSHGSLEKQPWGKSMDVGTMLNDYKPFSFEEIFKILSKRDIKIIDHHGSR